MGRELLRRSHVLMVCGDAVDKAIRGDITVKDLSVALYSYPWYTMGNVRLKGRVAMENSSVAAQKNALRNIEHIMMKAEGMPARSAAKCRQGKSMPTKRCGAAGLLSS